MKNIVVVIISEPSCSFFLPGFIKFKTTRNRSRENRRLGIKIVESSESKLMKVSFADVSADDVLFRKLLFIFLPLFDVIFL